MFAAVIARGAGGPPPRQRADADRLIAALAPFRQADLSGTWHDERALIVHAIHRNTPSSLAENTPETCPETGRVIASWLRLDNRAELCAALGLEERRELTDPQIILAAHRRWPRDCARHLEGDFSFVIHDPAAGETYCARDAMGAKPFYFRDTGDCFVAASSVAAISAVPGPPLAPNLQWIALYLSGFGFADRETAYEGVAKLPPGHDLLIAPSQPIAPRRYFDFDLDAPHANTRDPARVEAYREEFERAVDIRARSDFLIGSENSGGLDSASVIARLVEVLPHDRADFHTFALIAHQRELDLLDKLADRCGIEHTHKLIRPEMLNIDDPVARARTAIGHPPEHGQPLLSTSFFETSETLGIRTMMSGFGGDEIVTGYAKYLIDDLIERRDYRAAFREIEGIMPMRMARLARWVLQGRPHPDATAHTMIATKLGASCLSEDFLEDSGLRSRIEVWMMPERPGMTLSQITGTDPGFRHGRGGRLESSALYAATYGIEYRFPLYDRRLVQAFLKTPAIEKRRGAMGRYLHRRAIAGRIPDAIAWQVSKDMGPPLQGSFAVADQPRIAFADLPSPLRQILDPQSFDTLQDSLAKSDGSGSSDAMRAKYFLWHVLQLVAWLGDQ